MWLVEWKAEKKGSDADFNRFIGSLDDATKQVCGTFRTSINFVSSIVPGEDRRSRT